MGKELQANKILVEDKETWDEQRKNHSYAYMMVAVTIGMRL